MTNSLARNIALLAWLFAVPLRAAAQVNDEVPPNQGAAGLFQALLELKSTAKVMHIVAHPDDEDGAMLTYCARGLGAQTMLFSVTRGEGGANLISKHSFDGLGILRTLEHAESAKYYGVNVHYSSAADYGYSKILKATSIGISSTIREARDLSRMPQQVPPSTSASTAVLGR